MKRFLLIAVTMLIILAASSLANEFTLTPSKPSYQPGEPIDISVSGTPFTSFSLTLLDVFNRPILATPGQLNAHGEASIAIPGQEKGVYRVKLLTSHFVVYSEFAVTDTGWVAPAPPQEHTIHANAVAEGPYEIGKPVTWMQQLTQEKGTVTIVVPDHAEQVTVRQQIQGRKETRILPSHQLTVDHDGGVIDIEYQTPGPALRERQTPQGNEMEIMFPELPDAEVHVTAQLPTTLNVKTPESVRLLRKETGEYIIPKVTDNDQDGIYDTITWLGSEGTYIIVITAAEHLDEKRQFIEDIFDDVKELDGVWSDPIPDQHYVRVTFEQPLAHYNDITVFPSFAGNPRIEIYEKGGTDLIAEFAALIPRQYNKIYLDNLQGLQDTFDLRIVGSPISFDHIIDPTSEPGSDPDLRVQVCDAADSNSQGLFDDSCAGTYPSQTCASGGDRLSCNDNIVETHNMGNNRYAGVQINTSNSSVNDCSSIQEVSLCYEWWHFAFGGGPLNCVIEVDASGGGSFTTVTGTCPGTSSNPGMECLNVTANESWTCSNFFGSTGTRALARTNMGHTAGSATLTTDVLYFSVKYEAGTVFEITVHSPANQSYHSEEIELNVTASDTVDSWWYQLNGNGINVTFTPNTTIFVGTGPHNITVWANDTGGVVDTQTVLFSHGIPVDSCGVLDQADSVYFLENNIDSDDTCFNVTADNIVFDGKWHALASASDPGPDYFFNASGRGNFTLYNVQNEDFENSVLIAGETNGQDGGNLTIVNASIAAANADGSDRTTTGTAGNAGDIVIVNATLIANTISAKGGNANIGSGTIHGGDGGNVRLFDSNVTSITVQGGAGDSVGGNADGGNGGNITIQSGHFNSIDGIFNLSQGSHDANGVVGQPGHLIINYTDFFNDTRKDYGNNLTLTLINGSVNGGSIVWLTTLNGTRISNLSTKTTIRSNYAHVDVDHPSDPVALNASANITLTGTPGGGFIETTMKRYDVRCPPSICYNFTSLYASTVTFNVTHWSNFSMGENDSAPNITFIFPTPDNNSKQNSLELTLNVSSADEKGDHYTLVDFDDDIVAWHRMDDVNGTGDPIDLSSYGNNGTLKGNVLINESGFWGNGTYLDGTGDYIEMVHDESLNFDDLSFTASLWIKFPAPASGQRFFLAKKSGVGASGPGWVIYHQSDGDLTIMLADGTTRLWTRDNIGATVDDGNWHHVAFVVDGRDGIREYYDGNVQSPAVNEGPLSSITSLNNTLTYRIGARSDGGTMFHGYVDDVILFNRNLSAEEIGSLYNATATQYRRNVTELEEKQYVYTGYAIDRAGRRNSTQQRVTIDQTNPDITFINQTPSNDSYQAHDSIIVNLSTSDDTQDHYTFAEFDDDLLLWLTFDEVNEGGEFVDLSNKSANATPHGGLNLSGKGIFGDGLVLNGESDWFEWNHSQLFDFRQNASFFGWVKTGDDVSKQTIVERCVGADDCSDSGDIELFITSSGNLNLRYELDSCAISGGTNVADGNWHHVGFTYNGTTLFLYRDGSQEGTTSCTISSVAPTNVTFGRLDYDLGAESYFNGSFDDFLIFNRTLSQAEINALYNGTADQYQNNFTQLEEGVHNFTGFTADRAGNRNQTATRSVTIDLTIPYITFVPPTPENGSTVASPSIYVNISSSDNTNNHYTFTNFNDDLLFWMRFDDLNGTGDPTDLSSYGNDGALLGDTTINSTGYWGDAAGFDSYQDAVQMGPNNGDLIIGDGSNYTISAWINTENASKSQGVFLGASSNSRKYVAYSIYLSSNNIRCLIGNSTNSDNIVVVSSASNNTWYHIACVWNGTTHVTYSNGVEASSEIPALTGTLPMRGSVGTIRNLIGIEYGPTNANTGFHGLIDDVLIWNRTLSATEISALYNATATQYENNFTGLEDGTHNIIGHAVDRVGNRNQTDNRSVILNFDAGYLEVLFVLPDPDVLLNVVQNQTFIVNSTVFCRGASCGSVQGTVRYNASTSVPDTAISHTEGDTPLYIQGSGGDTATIDCSTDPLDQDEYCNTTWTVNATGAVNSTWEIGVLFNSSTAGVADNVTDNATIQIIGCVVDITTHFDAITFGTLNPNTQDNPAEDNDNLLYNITVNQGSCRTDLYIKGTNLSNSSYGSIGIDNLTVSNTTNDVSASTNVTLTNKILKEDVTQNTNVTSYYWFDVPPVFAAVYQGIITFTGVQYGSPAP